MTESILILLVIGAIIGLGAFGVEVIATEHRLKHPPKLKRPLDWIDYAVLAGITAGFWLGTAVLGWVLS